MLKCSKMLRFAIASAFVSCICNGKSVPDQLQNNSGSLVSNLKNRLNMKTDKNLQKTNESSKLRSKLEARKQRRQLDNSVNYSANNYGFRQLANDAESSVFEQGMDKSEDSEKANDGAKPLGDNLEESAKLKDSEPPQVTLMPNGATEANPDNNSDINDVTNDNPITNKPIYDSKQNAGLIRSESPEDNKLNNEENSIEAEQDMLDNSIEKKNSQEKNAELDYVVKTTSENT